MLVLKIFLSIILVVLFGWTLKHPIAYKPRQDHGDVIRWIFWAVIEFAILVSTIAFIWTTSLLS